MVFVKIFQIFTKITQKCQYFRHKKTENLLIKAFSGTPNAQFFLTASIDAATAETVTNKTQKGKKDDKPPCNTGCRRRMEHKKIGLRESDSPLRHEA